MYCFGLIFTEEVFSFFSGLFKSFRELVEVACCFYFQVECFEMYLSILNGSKFFNYYIQYIHPTSVTCMGPVSFIGLSFFHLIQPFFSPDLVKLINLVYISEEFNPRFVRIFYT